jgi:hypothetical protein
MMDIGALSQVYGSIYMKTIIAPRRVSRALAPATPAQSAAPPTPGGDATARSHSFNASLQRWNAERRGQAPGTIWGARAIEALAPWEDGDLCLAHAVAVALQAAYEEGKAGQAPHRPDVRADLRPSATVQECTDCDHPQEHVVTHAGNLHADGIDRTPRTPAPIHRAGMVKPAPLVRRPLRK